MSNTIRKFRGKQYRQGHEPCELELTRIRKERKRFQEIVEYNKLLEQGQQEAHELYRKALAQEQEEMGYGKQ